jgi:hypothetical protein
MSQAPARLEKLDIAAVLKQPDGRPRGFVTGEHLLLRPVLKTDLPALAGLLAEDPLPPKRGPWSLAKLEKLFDTADEPGLWGKEQRFFIVLDRQDGQPLGYVFEESEHWPGMFRAHYGLAKAVASGSTLGSELVRLHLDHLKAWLAPRRVMCNLLDCETDRPQWLLAQGFAADYLAPRHQWYLGRAVGLQQYVWLSDELRAQPAWSTGEPASSREVEPITDW